MIRKRKIKFTLVILTVIAVFGVSATVVRGTSHNNVLGWLWGGSTDDSLGQPGADTATGLGWISVTSDNPQTAGALNIDYGITVPSSNGPVTGYAWSSTGPYTGLGWIDFQPVADNATYPNCGYPTAPCNGVMRTGDDITGWARFLSIKEAFEVNGIDPVTGKYKPGNSGDWEGWIKMSDLSGTNLYGVSIIPSSVTIGSQTYTHRLNGFAWSNELGWINFGDGIGVNSNPPFPVVNFGGGGVPGCGLVSGTCSGTCPNAGEICQSDLTGGCACAQGPQLFSVSCSGTPDPAKLQITWTANVISQGNTSPPYNYDWNLPSGNPSTGSSGSIPALTYQITSIYNTQGPHNADVTVTAGGGETAQATCPSVTIQPKKPFFKLREIIPFF